MERLFSVGQLLPCCVQAVGGDRVNLSVSPKLINSHLSARDIKPNLVGLGPATSVCVCSQEYYQMPLVGPFH